jgi:hypothetical protein
MVTGFLVTQSSRCITVTDNPGVTAATTETVNSQDPISCHPRSSYSRYWHAINAASTISVGRFRETQILYLNAVHINPDNGPNQ